MHVYIYVYMHVYMHVYMYVLLCWFLSDKTRTMHEYSPAMYRTWGEAWLISQVTFHFTVYVFPKSRLFLYILVCTCKRSNWIRIRIQCFCSCLLFWHITEIDYAADWSEFWWMGGLHVDGHSKMCVCIQVQVHVCIHCICINNNDVLWLPCIVRTYMYIVIMHT